MRASSAFRSAAAQPRCPPSRRVGLFRNAHAQVRRRSSTAADAALWHRPTNAPPALDVLLLENFLHEDDFSAILEECTALR